MCSKTTESTKTTEKIDTLCNQISIEKQSNAIMKLNCLKRLNSSKVEFLKGVVLIKSTKLNNRLINNESNQALKYQDIFWSLNGVQRKTNWKTKTNDWA